MENTKNRLIDGILRYRRTLIFVYHASAVVAANFLSFYLRFDGHIPDKYLVVLPLSIVLVLAIRLPLFHVFGLYKGLWRYAGMADLQKILASVTIGSAALWVIVYGVMGIAEYPRSVIVMDWLLVNAFVGGVRLALRSYRDHLRSKNKEGKRLLIIGAGNAGEMIVRDMRNNPFYMYDPVGFIDDDSRKKGLTIHGIPIIGPMKEIETAIKEYDPDEFLIAIPTAEPAAMQGIIAGLSRFKLPVKTLPNLKDIIAGKVSVSQIRNLELEDLLERPMVKTDSDGLVGFVSGKRVMVTGAGGSIGSEICRQVAGLGAKTIIAFERHENSLYNLDNDFRLRHPDSRFFPVVGDVNDSQRVEDTLDAFKPDIVFHAAAHKHVPMMEKNPREAIKNNVMGTRKMTLLSEEHGVSVFVLISTDKAVNPTSMMGATKRACELFVSALDESSPTAFITVRFGNVLGSSGSVVPLFREQIRSGGPVTVTHPDMTRFLMMIPEAVQLVLQAASIGEGGEIFVLDMGEPIKIVDLARNLILLSGFEPDRDIKIEYVGLRPGEKLYEELFDKSEEVAPTVAEKVFKALPKQRLAKDEAIAFGNELDRLLFNRDTKGMADLMLRFVKTYTPDTNVGPVRGVTDGLSG